MLYNSVASPSQPSIFHWHWYVSADKLYLNFEMCRIWNDCWQLLSVRRDTRGKAQLELARYLHSRGREENIAVLTFSGPVERHHWLIVIARLDSFACYRYIDIPDTYRQTDRLKYLLTYPSNSFWTELFLFFLPAWLGVAWRVEALLPQLKTVNCCHNNRNN